MWQDYTTRLHYITLQIYFDRYVPDTYHPPIQVYLILIDFDLTHQYLSDHIQFLFKKGFQVNKNSFFLVVKYEINLILSLC